MAAVFNDELDIGASWERSIKCLLGDNDQDAEDLTGWTASMRFRDRAGTELFRVTSAGTRHGVIVIDPLIGSVHVSVNAGASSGIARGPGTYELDLLRTADGYVRRLLDGRMMYRPPGRRSELSSDRFIVKRQSAVVIGEQTVAELRIVDRGPPGPAGADGVGGGVGTVFTDVANGLVPASGVDPDNFLRADGTWAPPPPGDPPDLETVLGTGNDAGAAQIKNLADATDLQDAVTLAQLEAAAPSLFNASSHGIVPGSGGGTINFLRADGTWATPPDTVGPTYDLFSSGTDGLTPLSGGGTTNFLRADGTWAAPAAVPANGSVTLAMLANLATDRLIGRDTAGTGVPESIGVAGGLEFTGVGSIQRGAITGDVSVPAGSAVSVINTAAVSNSKLTQMIGPTLKGRVAATSGAPADLTTAQVTAMLDLFTSSLKGLAPASGGGTSNFLRADGTWAAPAGGAGMTGTAKGQQPFWNGTSWAQIGLLTGTDLTDANQTLDVSTAVQWILQAGVLTTARTKTLSTTGASAGIMATIFRFGTSAHAMPIANGGAGGGTAWTFPASAPFPIVASFKYDGTNWTLGGFAYLATVVP